MKVLQEFHRLHSIKYLKNIGLKIISNFFVSLLIYFKNTSVFVNFSVILSNNSQELSDWLPVPSL